jgi:peptidoglycan hydrolase-like protein with peptidoglycan-binding domain
VEAYYRAGTFTGGLLSTSQIVAKDAQTANEIKADEQGIGPDSPPVRSSALTGSQQQIPDNPPHRADPGPEILDPFEGSLTRPAVREIQQALCLTPTGSLGKKDSATRRAIADYLGARGVTPSQIVNQRISAFLDEAVERVDVRNGGTCSTKNFANALAVGKSFTR